MSALIGLSKSTLEVFQDCPRCFYMAKNYKIDRPKGLMPGITKGIDRVMKAYTATQLAAGKENMYLAKSLMAPHPDRLMLVKFGSWRTFQGVFDIGDGRQVKAWGELDDLLVDAKGVVSPWDYKSKGSQPDAEADALKYNQLQGDMYHLLLEAQGLKCSGFCYFTYTWPDEVISPPGERPAIIFAHETTRIATSPARALGVLKAAMDCLEGKYPESSPGCSYCSFIINRKELVTQ